MGIYTIDNQLIMKTTNREQKGNKKLTVERKRRRNHFVVRLLPFC